MSKKTGLGKGLSALMSEEYSAAVSHELPSVPVNAGAHMAPKDEAAEEDAFVAGVEAVTSGSDMPASVSAPAADKNVSEVTHAIAGQVVSVPVEGLHAGTFQPRRNFDEAALEELADSIRSNGMMQPIVARQSREKQGAYEIIAGERRWRAAQLAELNYVPVLVQEIDDKRALEQGLIENIQRQDLSAMEEADGYQRLMYEFSYTQDELSQAVGKSRSHVANLLRLLQLPDAVKALVDQGKLSMGHARPLLMLEEQEQAEEAAEAIIAKQMNVRQAEALCKRLLKGESADEAPKKGQASRAGQGSSANKSEEIQELEQHLSGVMGMSVTIDDRGNKGAIHLHYESLAQLDDILQRLSDSAI